MQPKQIATQLSYLANKSNKNVENVEKIQNVFQIQYDIQLLRQQVRNVKENLVLSQPGVISTDILISEEIYNCNITIKEMMNIKTSSILYKEYIIFVLFLPIYSKSKYYRVYIEPIPNKNNLEIDLKDKIFLLNEKQLYENVENIILKKNLKLIESTQKKCQVFEKNVKCNFKKNSNIEIKQILNNIIITKNIPNTKIIHNCNAYDISLSGNNLIKFENCKVSINNVEYENFVYDEKLVIPNFNNITVKNIVMNFSLDELHIKNARNLDIIQEIQWRNVAHEGITIGTIILILIIFIALIILIFYIKPKFNICKTSKKNSDSNSAEQNSSGGEVTSSTVVTPFSAKLA